MRLVDAICAERPSMSKRMTSFALTIFALSQHVEIRDDHGVQPVSAIARLAFQSHHADFLDVGRLQIVRFDLLGINILAIAQNDDFFLAAGEKQMAVRIEVARDRR